MLNDYERVKERARAKRYKNQQLSRSEQLALQDMWWFTFPLPVEIINKLADMAEENGCNPSDFVSLWIQKNIDKNT